MKIEDVKIGARVRSLTDDGRYDKGWTGTISRNGKFSQSIVMVEWDKKPRDCGGHSADAEVQDLELIEDEPKEYANRLTLSEYNAKQLEWMHQHRWYLGEKLGREPGSQEFLDSWQSSHMAEDFNSIYGGRLKCENQK